MRNKRKRNQEGLTAKNVSELKCQKSLILHQFQRTLTSLKRIIFHFTDSYKSKQHENLIHRNSFLSQNGKDEQ